MLYVLREGGIFGDAPPPPLLDPENFVTVYTRHSYNKVHTSYCLLAPKIFLLLSARYDRTFQLIAGGGRGWPKSAIFNSDQHITVFL